MSRPRPNPESPPRAGRPRRGEASTRRQRLLDSAATELVERGASSLTVAAVAARAGASKGTIYSWFGDRDGLLRALIERNADVTVERLRAAALSGDARAGLVAFATALLELLLGPVSLELNRTAIANPSLGPILLDGGRHRVGPVVAEHLAGLAASGELTLDDEAEAFAVLYGLVVGDLQIRALLGEPTPGRAGLVSRAAAGVDRFLALYAAPTTVR